MSFLIDMVPNVCQSDNEDRVIRPKTSRISHSRNLMMDAWGDGDVILMVHGRMIKKIIATVNIVPILSYYLLP